MRRRHFLCAWLAASLTIFASLAAAQETTTFTYDDLGRLTGANVTAGPTAGETTTIAYDPAGNRSNYAVAGGGGGTPSFSIGDASVTEGGTATFTVTKTGTASGTLTVNYATANGTATAGSDYNAASNTLTFVAGDNSETISIATTDDAGVESAETFTVTLSGNSAGSTIGDAQATGTINDNDATAPSFAIGNATAVTEGGNLVYTVTKTGAGAANVNYASANGTATSGSDFTATSGTLSFTSAQTTQTINVPTTDDGTAESGETVLMNLSGASGGATISDAQGSGTINDNDSAAPTFAIADATAVNEGTAMVFTVTKTGAGAANVNYASANGTATAGSDYTATSGTLSFTSAQTSKTITVPTTTDSLSESGETVLMNLSGPTGGATITDAQGSGTINNVVPGPSFAIANTSITEGSPMIFTVTKTGAGAANVSYASANGTASSSSDYTATSGTLSFASGDATKTISVTTTNDSAAESNETILMNLSSPTGGATISDNQATGTINDNDSVEIVRTSAGVLATGYSQHALPSWNPITGTFTTTTYVKYLPPGGSTLVDVCMSAGAVTYCSGWYPGYTKTGNGYEVTKP